jgi:glycosyltransferase involved in cell wall biosynthesis
MPGEAQMKILLVADGRSVITRRWVQGMLALGYQVSLISTFPCQSLPGVKIVGILPVAFSTLAGSQVEIPKGDENIRLGKSFLTSLRPMLQQIRYFLGPMSLPFYVGRFNQMVSEIQPDLVHALRIPFEGMLAAYLPTGMKLIISIWGNDLTLHARGSLWMSSFTRRALKRADGLISDTQRDIDLARDLGLNRPAPTVVLPGNGGIDLDEIEQLRSPRQRRPDYLKAGEPIIINPRGFRPGSVHQDVFFQSIPLVLNEFPNAQFICTAMQGQPEASKWVNRMGIADHVTLLPYLQQHQLWSLFLQSQVMVSLSSHDGTPNTLLEAMACDIFPVCGDIPSIREWIINGQNGLLVDPMDNQATANAILNVVKDDDLRRKAAQRNREIIEKRADIKIVRTAMDEFYKQMVR